MGLSERSYLAGRTLRGLTQAAAVIRSWKWR